jgi:hypothetical protein
LILRWVILFPEERIRGRRLDPRWAWAISLPFFLLRANYMLGGPLPVHLVPTATLAWDAIWVTALLAILSWNYRQAAPIGRRRVKWILVGAWIGLLPTVLNSAVGAIWPEFPQFQLGQALAIVAAVVIPLFILLAIVRFNAFDIDRLITATASYTLLIAVGLGALLTLVPWFAEGFASLGVGLDENVLSVALAFSLIPVDSRCGHESIGCSTPAGMHGWSRSPSLCATSAAGSPTSYSARRRTAFVRSSAPRAASPTGPFQKS